MNIKLFTGTWINYYDYYEKRRRIKGSNGGEKKLHEI